MKIPFANEDEYTNDQFLPPEPDLIKDSVNKQIRKSFQSLSSTEHLEEAKNALQDGYCIDADPMKTVWGRLNDAKRHLMAISPQAPQYDTAKGLADEVVLRKKKMRDAYAVAVNQYMVNQRKTLANELDQYFVSKGIYVEIDLDGADKTSLKISSAVFRVRSINRVADETAFFSHLRRAGFTSISFDNSVGEVKSYKLES